MVVVLGFVPLALDRDSYPLSTYPMFSSRRSTKEAVDTAVLVAGNSVRRLTPDQIAGTDEVIIAAQTVSKAIRRGDADALCLEIARRVDTTGVIEVVTERFDAVAWYEGEREPLDRVVHATCEAGQ